MVVFAGSLCVCFFSLVHTSSLVFPLFLPLDLGMQLNVLVCLFFFFFFSSSSSSCYYYSLMAQSPSEVPGIIRVALDFVDRLEKLMILACDGSEVLPSASFPDPVKKFFAGVQNRLCGFCSSFSSPCFSEDLHRTDSSLILFLCLSNWSLCRVWEDLLYKLRPFVVDLATFVEDFPTALYHAEKWIDSQVIRLSKVKASRLAGEILLCAPLPAHALRISSVFHMTPCRTDILRETSAALLSHARVSSHQAHSDG